MPASAALIARDQRILAGHATGAAILDLALAEKVDPVVVRRVLRAAGITPDPIRKPRPHTSSASLISPGYVLAEGR